MTKNSQAWQKPVEMGFTLIELSMVLVVMGLILGMVFKGKSLLEQAKNKSIQAQLHKIQLAVESFRQQYGHWPGDGCSDEEGKHCTGEKDGVLAQKAEQAAFWPVLIQQQLLIEQDRVQAFGKRWEVEATQTAISHHHLSTVLPRAQICLLDRQLDDGIANTGTLQGVAQDYHNKTTCQALDGDAVLKMSL